MAVPKKLPERPTPTQQIIIRALIAGPLNFEALAAKAPELKASNVTTQISWARRREWVTSSPDPADARRVVYAATEAGIAALGTSTRKTFSAPRTRLGSASVSLRIPADGMTLKGLDDAVQACRDEATTLLLRQTVERRRRDGTATLDAVAVDLGCTPRTVRATLKLYAPDLLKTIG